MSVEPGQSETPEPRPFQLQYRPGERDVRLFIGPGTLIVCLVALALGCVATPSTGYGADSAKQWPILVGVFGGTLLVWLRATSDVRMGAARCWSATVGAGLMLTGFGLQIRLFRLDPGFPQPRYRPSLLQEEYLLCMAIGLLLCAAAFWKVQPSFSR